MNLRSDEPAYYLMALSLAYDGDLRCEVKDIQRLRWEFPYAIVENLILMTDDGWHTVYFGKPFPIALLAAPLARWFGADGIVTTNMVLFLFSIWMGWRYLAQFNSEGRALLFSSTFFLLSYLWVYVFWIHTEVLTATAITAALYFGLTKPSGFAQGYLPYDRINPWLAHSGRIAASAFALAVAAYHKPILAIFAFPVLLRLGARGRLRDCTVWCLSALFSLAGLAGLSYAWTGQPTPYLGVERGGFRIEQDDRMPVQPRVTQPDAAAPSRDNQTNSWWWLLRLPEVDKRFLPNLLYFLVGRHTGLFVYAPFALVALLLWIASRHRVREQAAIAACLLITALFFLTLIPFNWHGGGGFVGNRYFVNVYPAFLFLVTQIPSWSVLVGSGFAGLFLGPLLLTPYGAVIPQPTLQAHVRNRPFAWLPREMTLLDQIPGYRGVVGAGAWMFGRSDVVCSVDEDLWLRGGRPVEIWFRTHKPLRRAVFQLESFVAPNQVELRVGDTVAKVEFRKAQPPDNVARLVLSPKPPRPLLFAEGKEPIYEYKIWVTAETHVWRRLPYTPPPPLDPAFGQVAKELPPKPKTYPWGEEEPEPFLVGVSLTFLGEEEDLEKDVYSLEWLTGQVPGVLRADRLALLPARVRNTSPTVWRAKGATRVSLAYHWLREDGSVAVWEGTRTLLPRDVQPGEEVELLFQLTTPRQPGRYLLALDAVRERVSWFSERNPSITRHFPVEIVLPEN